MKTNSQKQENAAAKTFGGRVTPGSGNGWALKADVRTETQLMEFKTTAAKQYTLKLADLLKIEQQALLDGGRDAVFGIQMGNRNWIVLPQEDYERLLAAGHEDGNKG